MEFKLSNRSTQINENFLKLFGKNVSISHIKVLHSSIKFYFPQFNDKTVTHLVNSNMIEIPDFNNVKSNLRDDYEFTFKPGILNKLRRMCGEIKNYPMEQNNGYEKTYKYRENRCSYNTNTLYLKRYSSNVNYGIISLECGYYPVTDILFVKEGSYKYETI